MSDLLVKLYNLKQDWSFLDELARRGVAVRKPLGPEKRLVVDWVLGEFGDSWASETDKAISNRPITCFIAVAQSGLVGFACYDSTALGFFGPTGVDTGRRAEGIGSALLRACLLDMKLAGYGYAVIGFAGSTEFYRRAVGAVEIPDSTPGIYEGWLTRDSGNS